MTVEERGTTPAHRRNAAIESLPNSVFTPFTVAFPLCFVRLRPRPPVLPNLRRVLICIATTSQAFALIFRADVACITNVEHISRYNT